MAQNPADSNAPPDSRKARVAPTELGTPPELDRVIQLVCSTYSNVHRGSGHFSLTTTGIFERARQEVLEYLSLDARRHAVVFCTPQRAAELSARLGTRTSQCLSSQSLGLPLGVRAVVTNRRALARVALFETGGGTARLVGHDWVVWAQAPDRFEAGTPAVINIAAFAAALRMQHSGQPPSQVETTPVRSAAEILQRDGWEHLSGYELLSQLRMLHVGRGIQVPTRLGEKPFVNLDNAASTPTFEPILRAYLDTLVQPASVQLEIVSEARRICAQSLGAPPGDYDVIFTSNTTEAINAVARSLALEFDAHETVVLNTVLEHNSNELPWREVTRCSVMQLGIDSDGFLDLQELETLLRSYNQEQLHGNRRIRLVAVSGASNVLGAFNDLREVCRLAHTYGARVLVDAAQLVAHRRMDMQTCGIDYLAFSAHKMYAPFGSGGLVARKGQLALGQSELQALHESGNENAAGIAALGKAFALLQRIGMPVIEEYEQMLTKYALQRLSAVPGVKLFGVSGPDSAGMANKGGVIAFDFQKRIAHGVARQLAEYGGIGVRSGCHCAHRLVKHLAGVPRPLERVQWLIVKLLPKVELPGVIRMSLGLENTTKDIDALVEALESIASARKAPKGAAGVSPTEYGKQQNDFIATAVERVYGANHAS